MENRRYRDGSYQARVNARRPFRHVRRIQKLANSATTHSSLLPDHYFIWDPTESVATRPLAWNFSTSQPSTSQLLFYTHDGNKNVSEVIASDTDVAAHYEYAPFGALTVSRGESAAANPFRFSSEYAENDTATVYYNYRHYEPVTGRWMQRDPIEEEGGNHLYRFAINAAVSIFDVLGRCSESEENGVSLTYVADSPGFDKTELFGRITHWGYNDLNDEGDFTPNSKLGKCQCVAKLLIIAHGEKYHKNKKGRFFWGATQLYEGSKNSKEYGEVTGLSDKFKNIKFCKKCFIDIRSCYSGAINGLAERVRANSRIFDDNVRNGFEGCKVRVYDEEPNVLGWLGKSRTVGK